MGENTGQIEREIRQERSDLDRNLRVLEDKTREIADWRTHHRNHPGLFVGLAFGIGLAAGLATLPARPRTARVRPERDRYEPARSMGVIAATTSTTKDLARRQLGDTLEHVADALFRVASAKVVEFVSAHVPGFRDQFERRGPEAHEYASQPRAASPRRSDAPLSAL